MTWAIAWSAVAEQDLRALPWRLAARVDASIMAFADGRAGEGALERMSAVDPYRLRLRLRGASALLWIEADAQVIHVARVLRNT